MKMCLMGQKSMKETASLPPVSALTMARPHRNVWKAAFISSSLQATLLGMMRAAASILWSDISLSQPSHWRARRSRRRDMTGSGILLSLVGRSFMYT